MGVVLAGCGVGDDDETTTTSPVAEGPVNPWDLSLEERPPLFDPCEEIPQEVIEKAVGSPMEPNVEFHNHETDALKSCGWSNSEVMLSVLSTWKSYDDYLADPVLSVRDLGHGHFGRRSLQMVEEDEGERRCHTLHFTGYGTVMINLSLVSPFREFDDQMFTEACAVLDEVGVSVANRIPEGDFR